MKTKCCDYHDPTAVQWNPFNEVVQCHNCGHVYMPKEYKEITQEAAESVNQ